MDRPDLNSRKDLQVRVKSLLDNTEKLIGLSDRLDAVDINLMLSEIAASETKQNRVFLSRCVTDGNFPKWKDIGSAAKDNFNSWYSDSSNTEQFELTLPLHLSRGDGGHWGVGRIICKKEAGRLKFTAEFYNPSGSSKDEFEKAKGIMDGIIESLVKDRSRHSVAYVDKIGAAIQGSNTFSCGFYTAEIERRLALGISIDELTQGSLDDNVAKINLLKSLLRKNASVEVVEDKKPAPQQLLPQSKVPSQTIEQPSQANPQKHTDTPVKPSAQTTPTIHEPSANLLADPRRNVRQKDNAQPEKAPKQKFELSEIQISARKLVIMNYLSSKIKHDTDIPVGDAGKGQYEFEESKLSEPLKTFYRTGEVVEGFELKGKILQYAPKEVLDPPVKEGEKKFMVNLKEEGGYLIMKGEYPFENSGRIKIPDGKTSVDIIVAIQVNGLEQFKDSLEFEGIDPKTNAGKVDFEKRMTAFSKLREQSRGSI